MLDNFAKRDMPLTRTHLLCHYDVILGVLSLVTDGPSLINVPLAGRTTPELISISISISSLHTSLRKSPE